MSSRVAWGLKTFAYGALILISWASGASAALTFTPGRLSSGTHYVLVAGDFDYTQDLSDFTLLVNEHNPIFVSFDSPGGNIPKAMELGRLIRMLGLATFQPREVECASACALAFLGGTWRFASPGAIGVHKSSFSDSRGMDINSAVSYVQQITAEIISYMTEMGVDPSLLQLSLQYDSDDIRYLSKSEMVAYRVTTPIDNASANVAVQENLPTPSIAAVQPGTRALPDNSLPPFDARFQIPLAKTGKVRHPEGTEYLRADASQASAKRGLVRNGDPVTILSISDRWYMVSVGGRVGYLHHNWVKVDQFVNSRFGDRYIQIASFNNYPEAQNYIRNATVPLMAYLATNHWFAVTLPNSYPAKHAAEILKQMKANGTVPEDAFMTVGNTYVRTACCE